MKIHIVDDLYDARQILRYMVEQNGQHPAELIAEDAEYLRRYSEVMATKLEEKVLELEKALAERKLAEEQLAHLNQRLESSIEQRTEQLNCRNGELIASEERYRNLVETMHEGILVVDGDGRLTYVNLQMSNMLGMAPDKVIGKECPQFIDALKKGHSTSTALEEVEISREEHQLESLYKEISGAFHDTFEGLERISSIVGSVKRFAGPGQDATALADLNDAIRNTLAVSTNEWKYVANVETDLDPALPLVPCNISDINQVILNLIVMLLMPSPISKYPFFTTKSVGKGSGQGLAIAQSLVTQTHHGTIDFETGVGFGTTFIIRLPLAVYW